MTDFPLRNAPKHPIVSARVPLFLKRRLGRVSGSPSESESVTRILDAVFRAHDVEHIDLLVMAIEAGHCPPRDTPIRTGRGRFQARLRPRDETETRPAERDHESRTCPVEAA